MFENLAAANFQNIHGLVVLHAKQFISRREIKTDPHTEWRLISLVENIGHSTLTNILPSNIRLKIQHSPSQSRKHRLFSRGDFALHQAWPAPSRDL